MTTRALTSIPSDASLTSAVASARALLVALDGAFVERRDVIRSLLVALLAREHVALLGDPGCIAGDSEIVVNRGGNSRRMPISHLCRMQNGGGAGARGDQRWDLSVATRVQMRGEDGFGRLGTVLRAIPSGVKDTWRVTTETGRTLRATADHPFYTPAGWRRLDELSVGGQVIVLARPEGTAVRAKKGRYEQTEGMAAHPFADVCDHVMRQPGKRDRVGRHERVPTHRLVAEAHASCVPLEAFVARVRIGDHAGLVFLDPAVFAVHHEDRNPKNNAIENLRVMTHTDHHRLHADAGQVLWRSTPETITAIKHEGPIETFDIAILEDEHNFTANGFVVHNTGKSAITNALTRAIGGRNFSVLMTKFTVPEEVFGPISLVGLEQDRYSRVTTGYLPEADVAFLDEVFKANSAILNALLTLVNERSFDNGGQRVRVPLEILIGASNELPQDESLGALWDRFMIRLWVNPIKNRDALKGLLSSRAEPAITATLSAVDLATLRNAVDAVQIPDEVLEVILDLRDALAQEHGIVASDRRWRKCMKLVCAAAVLDGRMVAARTDVMVLADSLWRTPEERAKVIGTMARIVSPDLASALRMLDAAHELIGKIDLATSPVSDAKATDGRVTLGLASVNDQLKQMATAARKLDAAGGVGEIADQIRDLHERVARATRAKLGL